MSIFSVEPYAVADKIARAMPRKILGSALAVVGAAAGVARHVAWYVSYQVDGSARDDEFARRAVGRSG